MEELFQTLGIEPGIIAVHMSGFVLLVLLLKRYAFEPIGDVFAQREREVEANLDEAERTRKMALADRKTLDREIAGLQERAAAIVADAEREADERRRELTRRAEEQSQQIVAEGERSVRLATERAREQLRAETAEIAVSVSASALRDALDEERQAALIDAFIADIERAADRRAGSVEP